jgi:hypothetical protein
MTGMRATKSQARVLFNLPGDHAYEVLEGRGKNDEALRVAIRAAKKTFNRAYAKQREKGKANGR